MTNTALRAENSNYRIEEVNAPYGYTLNENYYEVDVDSNTAYSMVSPYFGKA